LRGRTRYLLTVVSSMSMPSFDSSPRIRGAPQSGILPAHGTDQLGRLWRYRRLAGAGVVTFPVQKTETLTAPGDHRLGFDDHQRGAPIDLNVRQPNGDSDQWRPAWAVRRSAGAQRVGGAGRGLQLQSGAAVEGAPETGAHGNRKSASTLNGLKRTTRIHQFRRRPTDPASTELPRC